MKSRIAGFGGALVDWVVPVTDEEFRQLNLPTCWGGAKCLPADEFDEWFQRISASRKLKRFVGGSACNTLRAAKFSGADAKLLALLGDDEDGRFLHSELEKSGLDTSGLKVVAGHRTDCCISVVTPEGQRTMLSMLDAGQQVTENTFGSNDLQGYSHLHLEGYATYFPDVVRSILMAADGMTLSLDCGSTLLVYGKRQLFYEILQNFPITWLFGNEDEAEALLKANSGVSAQHVAERFKCGSVVTKGADGVSWQYGPYGGWRASVAPAQVVDTTGAGDSFAGAFLATWCDSADIGDAVRRGINVASEVISKIGVTF